MAMRVAFLRAQMIVVDPPNLQVKATAAPGSRASRELVSEGNLNSSGGSSPGALPLLLSRFTGIGREFFDRRTPILVRRDDSSVSAT